VLTKRPLLHTAADQPLYIPDDSRQAAVSAALRHRDTLVIGAAGSGKTTVLHRIQAEAQQTSPAPKVLYVDSRIAADARELIDLVLQTATDHDWVEDDSRPSPDDPFGPVAQLQRLRSVSGPACVLIDDPSPGQARILFGRYRDELWQLAASFVVAVSPSTARALLEPPADAFFDSIIELKPLDPDAAFELLRRRKDKGQISDQILWPSRPMQPRAILLDAEAGPTAGRHDSALQDELTALATKAAGRGGADLLHEIWGRGALSASDTDLQRGLAVTRARLTQLLRELERADILISFPEAREGGMGRPKTLYDIKTVRPTAN
jgi:RecA/RadA recombinase